LYGFSDGLWFITTSWPSLDPGPKRLLERPVALKHKEYWGWVDRDGLGPKIVWFKGFTFGETLHGGIRARIPKISQFPEGKYHATLVQQDDYAYLVFRVEQAQSAQNT
jgi:hypothetical protein